MAKRSQTDDAAKSGLYFFFPTLPKTCLRAACGLPVIHPEGRFASGGPAGWKKLTRLAAQYSRATSIETLVVLLFARPDIGAVLHQHINRTSCSRATAAACSGVVSGRRVDRGLRIVVNIHRRSIADQRLDHSARRVLAAAKGGKLPHRPPALAYRDLYAAVFRTSAVRCRAHRGRESHLCSALQQHFVPGRACRRAPPDRAQKAGFVKRLRV